ncbi:KedN5 family methylcobalamin-dependent radical SAM C-methyltransferase [Saccharomonospora piscinae]|uniref:KedN5 family methylcobalamin-dependent radical SAM C-methyltransferase n=1 Tax=Saccharomonospora piscinae TaxID=687388 RepID=UPI0004B66004|nr:KedN5 family methylcobalamin-dependent radical SAM C-methyltransferase [Saccharomonospora piscinae]
MPDSGKLTVDLVQQGIWDMPLESMPLASGYLKATALADDTIATNFDINIRNFRGKVTLSSMAYELFGDRVPDVLAFSVFGWSYRAFGALAATFKQLNPQGWVIFGGTHVANQADRTFAMFPEVDVVVNGEGELIFRDLLHAYLDGAGEDTLAAVNGISYRDAENRVLTTADRERIANLDDIPSPFLTNTIEMTDEKGEFRYDVALMETNRGCPYKCAFCYWGGAVGQKVRAFSRERLRAELEFFAKLRVHTIVVCDANFGLLPGDLQFVEDLIEIRDQYGFPRALETSWAKNKSKTFYSIVRRMKEAGMRSSFTLALQTLDDNTLELMNRKNMKVNDWEDLSEWLSREGLDCYAELIWGAPGETVESFMAGYDKLAERVSRIACYPMLLLPNTDYGDRREFHGIISVRGDNDDFEYVLKNRQVSFAENQEMQRFLFWARVIAEMAVFRIIWAGLRELVGFRQTTVLRSLDDWVRNTDDPAAEPLRATLESVVVGTGEVGAAISYLYREPDVERMLTRWWNERIRPEIPSEVAPVLDEMFRYDLLTKPVAAPPGAEEPDTTGLELVSVRGEDYYRRTVRLDYDIPEIVARLRAEEQPDLTPRTTELDLYYKPGCESAVASTNHETIVHFMAMTAEEVFANAATESVDSTVASLTGDKGGC